MDKKHFPDFYRMHIKSIYKFFYFRVSGRKEIAEDLTQDVFMKAFNAFESYDPATSRSAWIYMIARNHFINHLEKSKPSVDLGEVENTSAVAVDWAEHMSKKHDAGRLMAALSDLPKDDRELVRMKFLEGWGYDDIAKVMDKSAATLRVQAHRALKTLRAILKQK